MSAEVATTAPQRRSQIQQAFIARAPATRLNAWPASETEQAARRAQAPTTASANS